MGQSAGKIFRNNSFPSLLAETQVFATWTIEDLKNLLKRFRMQIYGFALVEVQFESLMAFKPGLAKKIPLNVLFDVLDNDSDGRVDGLELLGGLALICQGSFEDKARFCFELFDFNLNATLSKKEMIVMLMSSINGINMLSGGNEEDELDIDSFEKIATEAFAKADRDRSGCVTYDEFVIWARSNRVIMSGLDGLNRVATEAIEDLTSEDSAPEVEDGYLSGVDDPSDAEDEEADGFTADGQAEIDIRKAKSISSVHPWKLQVIEPTNAAKLMHGGLSDGPGSNLELGYVFGVSAQCTRHCVRYVSEQADGSGALSIVYPVAAVVVIYNTVTLKQSYYQGHSSEISAMAVHPNNFIVVTGDVTSNLHMWNVNTLTCLIIIDGMGWDGIQHIAFSPLTGDKFATVSRDNDHTIGIYDTNSGSLLSSGKSLSRPNDIFDIAFNTDTSEIAVVGRKIVKFYKNIHLNKRTLEAVTGKVGNSGTRQVFVSVTYINKDEAIVGCASGELYKFRNFKCIQMVQAHGIREPVFCLHFNLQDNTLVSGGADFTVRTWDTTLKSIGDTLDLSENTSGSSSKSINLSITSLHAMNGRLVLATRGSDIFEITIPAASSSKSGNNNSSVNYIVQRVTSGHFRGQMGSIAIHPLRPEFVTTGDDKTVRVWSIRSRQQTNVRSLPCRCHASAYDNNQGDILCLGMEDGSVALMESRRLLVYSTWTHSKERITCVKFSADNNFLVVGSADNNMYIYQTFDKRLYIRQALCRGHCADVTHLDVSFNNKFIRSNSAKEGVLLYWDNSGNLITNPQVVRDVVWHTNTCVYDWAVKGIWGQSGPGHDIIACEARPETTDCVTGDSSGAINIYKYPVLHERNTLYQSYQGHAGPVADVRYTHSNRYVVSIGLTDRSILVWRHELEDQDDSDDEAEHTTAHHRKSNKYSSDESNDHTASLIPTLLGECMVSAPEGPTGLNTELQPWKGSIAEPSAWTGSSQNYSTDVDLNLQWVHGYRGFDCKDNIKYNASGHIVYFAAAVAIVYNKSTGKQAILQGIHTDDVLSIAAHPAGQLFATGELGSTPKIVIWNSTDVVPLRTISDTQHSNGVTLLSFNSRGNVLASLGMDEDNTIAFHIWDKNILLVKTPTGKSKVFCMSFIDYDHSAANNSSSSAGGGGGGGGNVGGNVIAAGSSPLDGLSNSLTDVVVTGGQRHIKFWWVSNGKNIKTQTGLWGGEERNCDVLCVSSASPNICVTGASNGNVLIWENFRCVYNALEEFEGLESFTVNAADGGAVRGPSKVSVTSSEGTGAKYPHGTSPVQAICCVKGNIPVIDVHNGDLTAAVMNKAARYITADRSGIICFWVMYRSANDADQRPQLKLVRSINIRTDMTPTTPPSSVSAAIKSVMLKEGGGSLVIGTQGCEIYEIAIEPYAPLKVKKDKDIGVKEDNKVSALLSVGSQSQSQLQLQLQSQSHKYYADQIVAGHYAGEVWALCTHPILNVFFTAGDDCTVRCWDLAKNKLLSYIKLPEKCRALDILPTDGSELAIPLNSGKVWIISTSGGFLNPKQKPSSNLGGSTIDPELRGNLVEIVDDSSTANGFNSDIAGVTASTYKCLSAPLILKDGPKKWVQSIRYCFDGSMLAVGSHDRKIYLYAVAPREGAVVNLNAGVDAGELRTYTLIHELEAHSSFITQMDFGVCVESDIATPISQGQLQGPSQMQDQGLGQKPQSEGHSQGQSGGSVVFSQKYDAVKRKVLVTRAKPSTKAKASNNKEAKGSTSTAELELEVVEQDLKPGDIVLQSTCGAFELLFWRARAGTKVQSPSAVKDTWWATYTCTFGWPVQGIYPPFSDGGDINAVARSHTFDQVPCLAVVDDFKNVKLFNYPCLRTGAVDKCYKGHAGFVANVAFNHDDTYLVTAGGDDKCIFVWGTDIVDEIRRRSALMPHTHGHSMSHDAVEEENDDNDSDSDGIHDHHHHHHDATRAHLEEEMHKEFAVPTKKPSLSAPVPQQLVATGGDEFSAIKPWKSVVRAPSGYKEPAGEVLGEAPSSSLELKFVYGYRGWDCRNNIGFGDSTFNVIYHIAGVGVMYNSQTHQQVHNTEHDDDILCLDIHPEGHLVATGEIGKHPKIVLWDTSTGTTVKVIKFHTKGVSHLTFSSDGKLLISVGMDTDRIVAIHNVMTGNLVGTGKAGKGVEVYCVATGSNNTFVTVGKNHLKFYELPVGNAVAGEVPSKSGIYNKAVKERIVTSACFLTSGSDVITGMSSGALLLWKEKSNSKFVKDAHKGAITCLRSIVDSNSQGKSKGSGGKGGGGTASLVSGGGGSGSSVHQFISGGQDGFIHVWDGNQLTKSWSCDMNTSSPAAIVPKISAIANRGSKIIIGTKGAEIFEVDRVTNELFPLVQGHYGANSELWGMSPINDTNKNNNRFVTVCEDQWVRVWCGNSRRCISATQIASKARAITTTSIGTQIAIGCMNGRVIVLSATDLTLQLANNIIAKGWIQCMAYSNDNQALAVGSHDNHIYILDTKSYSTKSICKGHHSYITGLDFSLDSTTLQTTSGDYELMFWSTATGKQIKSASKVQDTMWATWSLPFGWPVQGIFLPHSDGTDINSVARSMLYDSTITSSAGKAPLSGNNNNIKDCLIATGDDFKKVKIFKYPVIKEQAKFKEYKGHSEHVTNVKFSNGNKYLYSTGGLDKAILQFEIKEAKNKEK